MNDDLDIGTPVRTKKPAKEPTDFTAEALAERKWETEGKVVERSDSHGVCYKVKHKGGTSAWYCRRELQRTDVHEYSPAERAEMIAKMSALTAALSVVERNEDMRCAYDDLLEAQRHIKAVLPTIKGMAKGWDRGSEDLFPKKKS